MNEEKLNELLRDASHTWRVPPAPRVEEMWAGIEAVTFAKPRRRLTSQWWVLVSAVAASLVVGVALGRFSAPGVPPLQSPPAVSAVAPPSTSVGEPYGRTTSELLGQTGVLLAALSREARDGGAGVRFSSQATDLLLTTRLLLDSPVGSDPRLRTLLEDLELVLAQIAQLPAAAPRSAELEIINEALEVRDVVPRIRVAVASLSGDAN
jgi:hypothetical protein